MFKWWDKPIDEIQKLIPLLHDGDLERVKREIKKCCGVPNEVCFRK
jgi:virginiamycin A acetyltransferase